MGRPITLSDEKILSAARRVFLERGIRATTAEVAREAGVAEGSLFKRWKTKHELFFSALALSDEEPACLRSLTALVGKGDVRQNLNEIGLQTIEFYRKIIPLVMMSWSNPAPNGFPPHFDKPNSKPVQFLRKVAGYFEAEMKKGRIARSDAEVLARNFLGSLWHFAFFETVAVSDELPMPAEMFLRSLVNMLWNGVRPKKGASAKESVR
jgi:AcrR family transcriptional regulator